MSATDIQNVFVFTDTPDAYGELSNYEGIYPVFVNSAEKLFERLKNVDVAGLVLEISKVMGANRKDRDRLFAYADTYPILRVRTDPRRSRITFLDSPDCFFANLEQAVGKRCRNHERKQVHMGCLYTSDDDPSMAFATQGMIMDISSGGCFVQTNPGINVESFVYLRIPGMSDSRPILSCVRWANTGQDETRPGLGLMFIDPTERQLEEIEALPSSES